MIKSLKFKSMPLCLLSLYINLKTNDKSPKFMLACCAVNHTP